MRRVKRAICARRFPFQPVILEGLLSQNLQRDAQADQVPEHLRVLERHERPAYPKSHEGSLESERISSQICRVRYELRRAPRKRACAKRKDELRDEQQQPQIAEL